MGGLQTAHKHAGKRSAKETVPLHDLKAGPFGIDQAFESAIGVEAAGVSRREAAYASHEKAGRRFDIALGDLEIGEDHERRNL